MADRERLQAEKMSVEARKREVEEQNREQEKSRKSIEDEKLKVETEKKVSEAALKRLERDRQELEKKIKNFSASTVKAHLPGRPGLLGRGRSVNVSALDESSVDVPASAESDSTVGQTPTPSFTRRNSPAQSRFGVDGAPSGCEHSAPSRSSLPLRRMPDHRGRSTGGRSFDSEAGADSTPKVTRTNSSLLSSPSRKPTDTPPKTQSAQAGQGRHLVPPLMRSQSPLAKNPFGHVGSPPRQTPPSSLSPGSSPNSSPRLPVSMASSWNGDSSPSRKSPTLLARSSNCKNSASQGLLASRKSFGAPPPRSTRISSPCAPQPTSLSLNRGMQTSGKPPSPQAQKVIPSKLQSNGSPTDSCRGSCC